MGEVATPNRPVRLLAVADKRLARRGGEAALPSGGRQLLAEGMHVLPRGDHATHQHLRLPSTAAAIPSPPSGFLLLSERKTP